MSQPTPVTPEQQIIYQQPYRGGTESISAYLQRLGVPETPENVNAAATSSLFSDKYEPISLQPGQRIESVQEVPSGLQIVVSTQQTAPAPQPETQPVEQTQEAYAPLNFGIAPGIRYAPGYTPTQAQQQPTVTPEMVAQKEAEFNPLPLSTKLSEINRLMPGAMSVVPQGATVTNVMFSGGQLLFDYSMPQTTVAKAAPAPTYSDPLLAQGFWNPTGYKATQELTSKIPAGASNVEITQVPATNAYSPPSLQATYTMPIQQQPQAQIQSPKSVAESMVEASNVIPEPNLQYQLSNPLGSTIRNVAGVGPAPPNQLGAGVVASVENIAYAAPRNLIQFGADFLGGMFGKQNEAKAIGDVMQMGVNAVVPKPPPTVTTGAVTAVMGGGTGQLQAATKNPSYAAGTILGDILVGYGVSKGVSAITGGTLTSELKQNLVQPVQERFQQTNMGFNIQDRMNMDYRVASELGETYKQGVSDKVISKVTGISAKEPTQGTTFLPTVETVPSSGWETRTTIRATETEYHAVPHIYESEPIDSIQNMIKGNPSKMQAGMDLFDFAEAPNSQTFGLSVQPIPPIDKASLVAKKVAPTTPLPLKYGLGEGYLVSAPETQTYPTNYEKQVQTQELNQKYGTPVNEPMSYNKYAYNMGSQQQLAFQKQNLPTMTDLLPKTDTASPYQPSITNQAFYKRTPFPVISQTPIAIALTTTPTTTKPATMKSPLTSTRTGTIQETKYATYQPMPSQRAAMTEEEAYYLTYPPTSPLPHPQVTPINPSGVTEFSTITQRPQQQYPSPIIPIGGTNETQFTSPPKLKSTFGGITQPVTSPISISGTTPITDTGVFTMPINAPITSPIYDQSTHTIQNPVPKMEDRFYTINLHPLPAFSPRITGFPSSGSGGMGGTPSFERPFLSGGKRKRRKEYPVLSAEDVLKL